MLDHRRGDRAEPLYLRYAPPPAGALGIPRPPFPAAPAGARAFRARVSRGSVFRPNAFPASALRGKRRLARAQGHGRGWCRRRPPGPRGHHHSRPDQPPWVDFDHLDTLCELEFGSDELNSMRRQIIDIAALQEGLDGRMLRDHLSARGYGAAIVRMEAQAGRLNSWFVFPDAALADAGTGLSQMLALYRKTVTLERELKIAERVLAEETTEGNFAASMTFAKNCARRPVLRSRSKASEQLPGGLRGLSHSLICAAALTEGDRRSAPLSLGCG